MRLVKANQATAAKRRAYFFLVDATDGMTPETGEAGGQPQVSTNGAAWTNTGIGTLTAIGNGRYYADPTQALVATAGDVIETRYKSAATAECPGDTLQVVAFDPDDAAALGLSTLAAILAAQSAALDPLLNAVPGSYESGTAGAALGRIGAGDITTVSPVSSTGVVTLIRSDDHFEADDRALTFTSSDWPDLTDATDITMTVRAQRRGASTADPVIFSIEDTLSLRVVGVGSQTVAFEPTALNTATVVAGVAAMKYDIQATLANGHIVTLQTGTATGIEDQTRPA